MDRFIEASVLVLSPTVQHLKSNMDRFIALAIFGVVVAVTKFKIQYG